MLRELRRVLSRPDQRAWREVHWPLALDATMATSLLRQVGGDAFVSSLVLEVEATAAGVVYRVGVPAPSVTRVEGLSQRRRLAAP